MSDRGPREFPGPLQKKKMKIKIGFAFLLLMVSSLSLLAQEKTISVIGEESIKVKPDVAYLLLGVENQNSSAQDALKDNAIIVNRVIGKLKEAGVRQESITIHNPTLSPFFKFQYFPPKISLAGFQAFRRIVVTLNRFEGMERYIDIATKAGANVWGRKGISSFILEGENTCILYSVKDYKKYESQALKKALKEARKKAGEIALSLGKKIKGMRSFSEETYEWRSIDLWLKRFEEGLPSGPKVANLRDIEILITVRVTYTLE